MDEGNGKGGEDPSVRPEIQRRSPGDVNIKESGPCREDVQQTYRSRTSNGPRGPSHGGFRRLDRGCGRVDVPQG